MSNKTLMLTIIGIVVLCAAAAGFFYWQQTKPLKVTDEQIKKAQEEQKSQPNSQLTLGQNDCQRNFDENKLKNDKVDPKGRQVEIDVKDFGKVVLEFYEKDAPKAVENFLRLTNAGYYDCLTFHRVAKDFVIQGGDPSGDGRGGQSAFGAPFSDELISSTPSGKAGYLKGVLAMANSGPNTNGSQFFVMLADAPQMPHLYTIFGKVVSGLDVVDKIGRTSINPQMGPTDGAPVTPVVMESVKIIK